MPADPNFDALTLEQNPYDGTRPYFDNSAIGYPNTWAYDAGSVVPAGTVEPATFTRQRLMTCCWPAYDINYYDGTWHHTCADWNDADGGPDSFAALVGDAADAALAAHPDITHFTLEPQGGIELNAYQNSCPSAFSFDGAPVSPTNPPADDPAASVSQDPDMGGHEYASASGVLDVAVNYQDVWYVDDYWGPGVGAPYAATYPTFASIGVQNGAEAYLLRPTALTWVGQDPLNTANRIFWQRADIPDAITHTANWTGGHPTMTTWISVRGWKWYPATAVARPVICFV